ncbi:hypothetical protein NDA16_001462 [Ustilago loliicola]|nr:hypothetical protein NDA16_001462 [Ustilago loliicola]
MLGTTRSALLSALILTVTISPLGALGSVQNSNLPLDKRAAASDGSECWRDFASDPRACPVVQVAFFEDTQCSKPLNLVKTQAFNKGNEQMLFESAVAHSVKKPFGSIRVLGAAPGIGIGFAKEEESDMVVQNMAFMSSADTHKAYQLKQCVTFPNLDASRVGVWTVKWDASINQQGYVWNQDNIPLKSSAAQCHKRNRRASAHSSEYSVCLEGASWGGGGVLDLYTNDDCSGPVKRQIYSTTQCTPLSTTSFKSFKAVSPLGLTIDAIFSPTYYDFGKTLYHACAQRDVTAMKFKPGQCQKFTNAGAFVGVYGNDPQYPQPGPGPNDKILKKGSGRLLVSPAPVPAPGSGRGNNIQ